MTDQRPDDVGPTDEIQALALSRWLAGDLSEAPDTLDADVVEIVYALRPDLAPAPRISVDDILAAVTAGPLATLDSPASMPANASVAPSQPVQKGSNRPWMLAILGAGGMTALAAAAALLITALTFTATRSSEPSMEVVARPSAVQNDAVAVVDTGAPGAAVPARRERKVARARPRPSSPPSAKPSGRLLTIRGGSSGAPAVAKAKEADDADDAVAFADEGAGLEYDDERKLPAAADDVYDEVDDNAYGARSRPQMIPELAAEEALDAEPVAAEALREEKAAAAATKGKREAEARRAPAPEPASVARGASSAPAAPLPAAPAEDERSDSLEGEGADRPPSASLARRARRGAGSASSPTITAVVQALAANNPSAAASMAQQGLTSTAADSLERQRLYALLGDAHTALGDVTRARQAYEQADAIRQRR